MATDHRCHDTSAKYVTSPTLLSSLGWPSQTHWAFFFFFFAQYDQWEALEDHEQVGS